MDFPPLPCSQVALRLLTRAKCYNDVTGELTTWAYLRRAADTDGLSVCLNITPDAAFRVLQSCYGVASLHVGRIRDAELDVIQDEPEHGCITGVPYQEHDPLRAEIVASRLVQQSRRMLDRNGQPPS